MKKNIGKKALTTLAIVLAITATTVFAANEAKGNFSLTYLKWDRSSYIKLVCGYPLVEYKAQKSDNSTLKVTLSKKAYFGLGFDNVEIQHTDIHGNDYSFVYFGEHDVKKEYLITTLNTKSDSVANASYTFTS